MAAPLDAGSLDARLFECVRIACLTKSAQACVEADALILQGANVNAVDALGTTPIMLAAIFGRGDLIRMLIETSREALKPVNIDKHSHVTALALASACVVRHFQQGGAAAALLDLGADKDSADANGVTPLMLAVMTNNLPAAEALLRDGADVKAMDNAGNSVLTYAATKFDVDAVMMPVLNYAQPHMLPSILPDVVLAELAMQSTDQITSWRRDMVALLQRAWNGEAI